MRLHEYQAKNVFADAGIPVPESHLATSVDEVVEAVADIGFPAAIKAQVHVGGRGKAGGIKIATSEEEAEQYAEEILGMDLKGYTVEKVLVEAGVDFENELYVGITMDRGAGEPVAMVSTEGGVDIESVAEETPEAGERVVEATEDFEGRWAFAGVVGLKVTRDGVVLLGGRGGDGLVDRRVPVVILRPAFDRLRRVVGRVSHRRQDGVRFHLSVGVGVE